MRGRNGVTTVVRGAGGAGVRATLRRTRHLPDALPVDPEVAGDLTDPPALGVARGAGSRLGSRRAAWGTLLSVAPGVPRGRPRCLSRLVSRTREPLSSG